MIAQAVAPHEVHVLYRLFDANDTLLYVGITNDRLRRLGQHVASKPWFSDVTRITFEPRTTREDAKACEAIAIANETPKYNVYHPVIPLSGPLKSTGSFVVYDGGMKSNEIKAEIVRAGVTQREIAKIIGIRHESLSRILRDEVSDSDVARIRAAIQKASATSGSARLALGDS